MPATSSAFIHNSQNSINHGSKAASPSSLKRNNETALKLYRSAAEAIAEAERVCAMEGAGSDRCKVAWDIVEELKATDAHVRKQDTTQTFDPGYYPMVNSLELLTEKVDRKMDELKKLSTELAQAGAGPEVERLVYASDEFKQILAEARAAMDQYR